MHIIKPNPLPILGQPKIKDWVLSFIIGCPCGADWLFTGAIGATAKCPGVGCLKVYRVMGPPSSEDGVSLNVPLGVAEVPGV
jgi:hypothetical protein